jgi:small conductance mechanosensitive channel
MEETLATVSEFAVVYGMKIIAALAIYIVGRSVVKIVANVVAKVMSKKDLDKGVCNFVTSLVGTGLLIFVIIAALGQLGIQTTSFVAIIGAAGLAVGLALQGSLANFAAGFLILIFKPFKVGNFVELAGTSGVVVNIHIFTTELKTGDNKQIIIPNSSVTDSNIVNYSTHDTRRVDLIMGIGYEDDIDKAKAIMHEICDADARVLKDPAVTIAVVELADSSVNFVLRPWVKSADYWAVYFDLNEQVKKRFDAEGVSIPYPQRDVHFHQVQSEG